MDMKGSAFQVFHEMDQQQDRRETISLLPTQIAGLLALLLSVERYAEGPGLVHAAAHLRGAIEADSGIEVHPDAIEARVQELIEFSRRG